MNDQPRGIETSEFWVVFGGAIAGVAKLMTSSDWRVQVASILAVAALGTAYMLSRGRAKAAEPKE